MAAKILVVDDEPDVREILRQSLEMEGYEVVVAVDGRDAIDQFKAQAADLVITDMRMPRANGLDVLKAVKAHDPLTEVIVLTGYGTLKNAVLALQSEGAFHYLTKPLEDIGEFLTTVRKALERRLLRRQNQSLLDKLRDKNRILEKQGDAAEAARIELEEALKRYRSIVNAIPIGIIEVDTEGIIKFANTACHQLLRFPPGELPGHSVYELMPDGAQRRDLHHYIETLLATRPRPSPKIMSGRTVRGHILDLLVNWNYQRREDGSLAGFVAVLTNIREAISRESHSETSHTRSCRRGSRPPGPGSPGGFC
jgi:PAS domain S-box-containing protein